MIKTKRCELIKFDRSHHDFYHDLQTNQNVRKYLGGIPSKDHIDKNLKNIQGNSSNHYWVVKGIKQDTFIGYISLVYSDSDQLFEMSYEFLPKWWGQGYAYETIDEVVKYALNELSINELFAITQSKNNKSRALLEKIGMIQTSVEIMFDEEQSIYHLSNQ